MTPAITPCYNIAHRGARSLAPENTMAAFVKAWEVGAHGVETDVSITADGRLILFHDSSLKRTTNIKEVFPNRKKDPLHRFTLKEVEMLDAGSWFVKTDPFGTIRDGIVSSHNLVSMPKSSVPLLEELLVFAKEKSWFVNIEIKTLPKECATFPVVEHVLSLIEQIQLPSRLFSISSFYHPYLLQAIKLRPDIEINALIGGNHLKGNLWGNYQFAIYNANADFIDMEQIYTALQHGSRVNLYTVNDVGQMHRFLKAGVDKIITDFPQLLAQQHPPD